MKLRRSALLLVSGLACACAGSAGGETGPTGESAGSRPLQAVAGHAGSLAAEPAPLDCTSPPEYADVAAFRTCTLCHSSERSGAGRLGAPAAINFDSEAEAKPYASAAQRVVSGGIMPPRSSGVSLTEAEKQQLYTWASCMN